MVKRTWCSGLALAAGISLLALAFTGGASGGRSGPVGGGTMRLNISSSDVDHLDPSLAYGNFSWELEATTSLMLYTYPDKGGPAGSKLQPEAAAGFPIISKDGKTYTITVKKGFRFSDGKPVTAANFAFAINRALSPAMQSPAVPFIAGEIVGAPAVLAGKAKTASGVTVKGNRLMIRLTKADGSLVAKLGMRFFQAIETSLRTDPKGVDVYASGGPYQIVSRQVGRKIVLRKNPYYSGSRSANVDEFQITVNTNLQQSLLQVKANQVDYDMGGLPSGAHAGLAKQYGVNKGQYQVHPLVETDYIALNTSRGRTFNSVALRKAANYAVDRGAVLRVFGLYSGTATDQILPPNMRGFRDAKIYPLTGPDYDKAKRLAGTSCGTVKLWSFNDQIGQNLAQVAKQNLSKIGCDVNVKLFQGFQIFAAAGKKGADFDAMFAGWFADYPDPYDFLDILLNGDNIQQNNNNNLAYLDVPALNKQLAAASRLTGDARYLTYGRLDVLISSQYAPWVATDNRNQRDLIAKRVGGYIYQPSLGFPILNVMYIR
jgi:ABC-type oligopeptide transport system substrate-binding subunit